ncbi:hypothetical protein HPP92_021098 [Vanilla planifolia]|uniref:Uncharacterized protein n=1 Tax=Vanilla planifolia TaxID=51239 RepID=A0A835PYH7_VANPL|nr:hypothetical protein HPP92_021098 [Vanilla planifolia]
MNSRPQGIDSGPGRNDSACAPGDCWIASRRCVLKVFTPGISRIRLKIRCYEQHSVLNLDDKFTMLNCCLRRYELIIETRRNY